MRTVVGAFEFYAAAVDPLHFFFLHAAADFPNAQRSLRSTFSFWDDDGSARPPLNVDFIVLRLVISTRPRCQDASKEKRKSSSSFIVNNNIEHN